MYKSEWVARTCTELERYDTEHIETMSKMYEFLASAAVNDETLKVFVENFKKERDKIEHEQHE